MPLPAYGTFGHAFVASRVFQILTLLVTVALTSHCISQLVHDHIEAPGRIIGYLTISCLGVVYSAFTLVLYVDSALPFALAAICDGCLFFAYIALSILFGEGVSSLSCRPTDMHIPVSGDRDIVVPSAIGEGSYNGKVGVVSRIMRIKRAAAAVADQVGPESGWNDATNVRPSTPDSTHLQPQSHSTYSSMREMDFGEWVRISQRGCQMMKATWAIGLVVLVLFLLSMGSVLGVMWKLRQQKKEEKRCRESKLEENIQWST